MNTNVPVSLTDLKKVLSREGSYSKMTLGSGLRVRPRKNIAAVRRAA